MITFFTMPESAKVDSKNERTTVCFGNGPGERVTVYHDGQVYETYSEDADIGVVLRNVRALQNTAVQNRRKRSNISRININPAAVRVVHDTPPPPEAAA